jgi:uncharacterized protein (TIGR02270 family)
VDIALILADVVRRHAEIAADLYSLRSRLVAAGCLRLFEIRRLDDRIDANLDGLSLVGEDDWPLYETALDSAPAGALFTRGIQALKGVEQSRLDRLFEVAEGDSVGRAGFISAFGWLKSSQLRGKVVALLVAPDSFRRLVGISACAMHRIDPGLVSARRLLDPRPSVRARALRTAGEIGCLEAVPALDIALRDDDDLECRFWAVTSAVLLGSRGAALRVLMGTGLATAPHRLRAFRLSLQTISLTAAHDLLRRLADDPGQRHWLIQGSGLVGDPVYMPWLIKQMTDSGTARLAGEAFSLITGLDFGQSGLEGARPEKFESGPNDDPDGPNVDMDPDDGLPWPDVPKIEKWWAENSSRFQKGTRYFMGAPVTREHCVEVLKNGYQRQRILAAHYLCLLDPGTPLFNTSAPAWRQQRLLAKMT